MSDSDLPKSSRKAVGIDLGTTFSAIGHIDAYGKPQIIPNAESERITPSLLVFDFRGQKSALPRHPMLNTPRVSSGSAPTGPPRCRLLGMRCFAGVHGEFWPTDFR